MKKVAFSGAGRMASAMVQSLLAQKHFTSSEIICTSADDGTGTALAANTGIAYTTDPAALLAEAETLVLAIKPQQLAQLPTAYAALSRGKLILSILAGTPVKKLAAHFPQAGNIVRAMPNTPGQIGAGITAYASRDPMDAPAREAVEKILGSLGAVLSLPEEQLDAVTAVSGSGPAYLFEFVAALREGAVAAGLPAEIAARLALETTLGSARLLAQEKVPPETLRDRVTSPGGTTLAGLDVMQKAKFRQILRDTVLAARNRSIELSRL